MNEMLKQIDAVKPPEEYDLGWDEVRAVCDRESSPMAACYDAFKLGFLRGQQSEREKEAVV